MGPGRPAARLFRSPSAQTLTEAFACSPNSFAKWPTIWVISFSAVFDADSDTRRASAYQTLITKKSMRSIICSSEPPPTGRFPACRSK